MHRPTTLLASIALLFLLSGSAFAGYEVDASSHNWMASRDYSADMIADDDPTTAWAEGGTGAGEGEWVSFTFDEPLKLARIGVRNGDQREGDWERCNRVREMRVEYGGGREKTVTLGNAPGLQYVDIDADQVGELKLTILSIYDAENFWTRGVTCISDVTFEAYLDPAQAAAASQSADKQADKQADDLADKEADEQAMAEAVKNATVPERPEVTLKPVRLPDATPEATEQTDGTETAEQTKVVGDNSKKPDWKDVLPGDEEAGDDDGEDAVKATQAETEAVSEVEPEPEPVPEPEPAMADPKSEAMEVVRQYYLRLNTLDKTFPDLMASEVYDQELLSFLYFEEIQKQLGTAKTLRDAEIDLSELTITVRKLYEREARVNSVGSYTVATPGQKLEVEEDARFVLILEDGTWKIKKKEDD